MSCRTARVYDHLATLTKAELVADRVSPPPASSESRAWLEAAITVNASYAHHGRDGLPVSTHGKMLVLALLKKMMGAP